MSKKKRQTYSEAFKKEKVSLLESGSVRLVDLVKMFGVSYPTLYKWKEKHGSIPPTDVVVLEKDSEYKKNKELRDRISKMESLLGRQQMELDYYKQVVKQASENMSIDIEKSTLRSDPRHESKIKPQLQHGRSL